MTILVSIAGTWQEFSAGGWAEWESPWWKEAERQGFKRANSNGERFEWTSEWDGFWGANKDWETGGKTLRWFLRSTYAENRENPITAIRRTSQAQDGVSIVAHSHGGQVAAYGLFDHIVAPIRLVTVGTPVRWDMNDQYKNIPKKVLSWTHIYATRDFWQFAGGLFDGFFGVRRRMDYAHRNIEVPGNVHGGLMDPALWTEKGWWRFLKN